jgi:xanthine dehydrogenase accessory factor
MGSLNQFFAQNELVIKVELTDTVGSSPRNSGTVMYVCDTDMWGTIGGGQLEYMVIDHARQMLSKRSNADSLQIPLGPDIGQCCGGHVKVSLTLMKHDGKLNALAEFECANKAMPSVYVLGAGHVGRALANLLQHLPVNCALIDTRAAEIALSDADVEKRVSAIPEYDIQSAPAGSAFVILTHDHSLDFILTSAALNRSDAAYVGMIGSTSKRAKLASWCKNHCDGQSIEHLKCPIGADGSSDKRPSVIASFVVAEIMAKLTSEPADDAQSVDTVRPLTFYEPT